MGNKNNRKFITILIGIFFPVISTSLGRILGVWNSYWGFLILATLYISAGAYIWEGTFKSSLNPTFLVLLFIPVGVLIDVYIDNTVWHYDRNLFPIEIVLLWLFVPIFLFSGMGLRNLLLKQLKKPN